MKEIIGKWDGGYIRRTKRGRAVYVIRRTVNGKEYELSTGASTSKAAHAQLARFEADPTEYAAGGTNNFLGLSEDVLAAFLEHSRDVDKNSPGWRDKQRRYLAWWAKRLEGRDLRRVNLARDILPALDGATARGHRIEVLKRLYSWLRRDRHLIKPADDPTLDQLQVPQSRPEQWRREKAIPRDAYLALRDRLTGHWRDTVDVLAGTGWHVTELIRFVKVGEIVPYVGNDPDAAAVLVSPQHKSGEPQRTAVTAAVRDAAAKLRVRGSLCRNKLLKAMRFACGGLTIDRPAPGSFRHAVATWAINSGAHPAAVSGFLGQKSPRTMKRFYATHAVPGRVPTLL